MRLDEKKAFYSKIAVFFWVEKNVVFFQKIPNFGSKKALFYPFPRNLQQISDCFLIWKFFVEIQVFSKNPYISVEKMFWNNNTIGVTF